MAEKRGSTMTADYPVESIGVWVFNNMLDQVHSNCITGDTLTQCAKLVIFFNKIFWHKINFDIYIPHCVIYRLIAR